MRKFTARKMEYLSYPFLDIVPITEKECLLSFYNELKKHYSKIKLIKYKIKEGTMTFSELITAEWEVEE